MFTVNKNPTRDDLRKFGWAMLLGFGVLGVILWFVHSRKAEIGFASWDGSGAQIASSVMWAAGVFCCVISLASPAITKPIYVTWMSVTVPIGLFMSTVMLTVLFVVILPVFSLIVRRTDPLRKKLKKGGTYWEDYKPHEPTIERMRRPF
jgi:protein-S-isoprenylcysteine O-methyltransferase Ste14